MRTVAERFDAAYSYLVENDGHGWPLTVTAALGFSATQGEISVTATGDPSRLQGGRGISYMWADPEQVADSRPELCGMQSGWLAGIHEFADGNRVTRIGEQTVSDNGGLWNAPAVEFRASDAPPDMAEATTLTLIEQAVAAHADLHTPPA